MIGIPILIQIVTISLIISHRNPTKAFYLLPVVMILYIGLFFGWFYSMGTNLYKKLPVTTKMNLTRFKIFLFIPVIYIIFLSVFILGAFLKATSGTRPNPEIISFIIPLHLFSMFCIFYCLYFNAKALKSVEWQRPVTFSDFAGEFFLIWFFPVGIWIIQPRINKLFDPAQEGFS